MSRHAAATPWPHARMRFCSRLLLIVPLFFTPYFLPGSLLPIESTIEDPSPDNSAARLTIAFVSNRGHYWYPHVFLYEHDGAGSGKIVANLDPQDKRLDHHPALSADARYCVFGTEYEAQVGQLQYWDLKRNTKLELGDIANTPNTLFSPSLSADGRWLAFSGWNRPGTSARWDIFLYDLEAKRLVDLPQLNTSVYDERRSAISADGNWIAFTTNAVEGRGLTDIWLYDRQAAVVLPLSDMNSSAMDNYPALSAGARWVCFASDREGGMGGLDIFLFDRVMNKQIELPGLNTPGHEQSPSITADGRFIAFVAEHLDAEGEHDIFVYDRLRQRLVPTPGLNTDRDDYDPFIVEVRME